MRTSLPRHPKKRGEWVEAQFLARAIACGLTISRPWGDCARYDFVVELASGALVRIQVKGTSRAHGRGYVCLVNSFNPKRPLGRPYKPGQVDFFAFYIIPEDTWFIVPFAATASHTHAITVSSHNPANRFFQFHEAWPLLGVSPEQPPPMAPPSPAERNRAPR
jgi:hypothetical protein